MPDLKISQLPAASTPLAGTELVPIVQGGTTDQTTVQAILTSAVPSGTANGVLYLNGSKVVTSGSVLTFDGTNFGVGTTSPAYEVHVVGSSPDIVANDTGANGTRIGITASNTAAYISTTYSGTGIPLIFTTDGIGAAGNEKMRLDSSGNLGLGVTPSAWAAANGQKALQIAGVTSISQQGNGSANVMCNAYESAANAFSYVVSAGAMRYNQSASGGHSWHTAPSGTAGNAISFSQVMTLDASGNLGVGETSLTERITARKDGTGSYCTIQAKNANSTATLNIGVGGSAVGNTALQNNGYVMNAGNSALVFGTNDTERARIPAAGGMVVGTAALATSATDGFLYVPTCAGTPTGTPTTQTGTAPIVVDTTNNKLYFYSGGQWRDAGP